MADRIEIRAGKKNGKKCTGIVLCLLTAVCSGKGGKLLETRPKWRETGIIKDWILLLETSLEWEAWLNSDKMMKSDIQKAKAKHRHIMHLMRNVAVRQTGMGLKWVKFNGVLHMADAVLNFSVPLEHDTQCNESHHIPAEKASMLTQQMNDSVINAIVTRLIPVK